MTQPASNCTHQWCHRKARSVRSGVCQTHYERGRNGLPPRFASTPIIEYAQAHGFELPDMGNEVTLERMDAYCIDVLGVHPYEVLGNYYFDAA